ncbi:MAG: protein kinase domain-containing protein [Polyangiaceae bacterium]|jgi:eukaryotic-like serine/threonine-protein kinase
MSGPSAPSRILAGKYRVICALGEGGMGEVLLATHLQLDQKVAIKVLKKELAADPIEVERFLREARAAARINNDHVVRVSDVASLETGQPYIVMEYLEGEDLAKRLESGPLPIPEAVDCVLQACLAIAEAHRVGIVHRDLKPANLFLVRRRDGSNILKVVDFGISKLTPTTGRPEASLTQAGMMGSPFYMSPEQIMCSADLDRRTDLWSLGLILFELITAEGPFEAATMAQLCQKIVKAPARRLREARPDLEIPDGLEDVIARCLAKNPADRYEDTVDLAQDLVPYAQGSSTARLLTDDMPTKPPPPDALELPKLGAVAVPVAVPTARTAHGDAGITSNTWNTAARRAKGRQRTVALAVAGGAVVLACAVLAVWRLTGTATRPASAASSEVSTALPSSPHDDIAPTPPPTGMPADIPPPLAPSVELRAPSVPAVSSVPPAPPAPRAVRAPVTSPTTSARPTPPAADEFGGRK